MTNSEKKELQLLDKASGEFAKKMLAPEREENDKYPFGTFFQHILDKAFDLDFFHIMLPEDTGGTGHGIEAFCVILDNICREDSSLGGILYTTTLAQQIMLAADAKSILSGITDNSDNPADFLIAFQTLCNPSEVRQLPAATGNGNGYTLSGTVDYLVLGNIAGHALIPASTGGQNEYSFFLVAMKASGITVSEPVVSHGLHACPAVDVTLKSTPATLVGAEGQGAACFKAVTPMMQLAAAAMSCGIMKGAVKEAFAYCSERVQGGRKIKDWSALQMILADMAIKTQVADMLVSQACQAARNEDKGWQIRAQAASLHIQDSAASLVSDGIQALGGVGYMKDFGQEKRFRDAGQINAFLGLAPMKKLNLVRQLLSSG
ncbi:MAG: acyl-CoA dehydrogenase family protein [Thermodesulfobacteriota bacterium]|nr:acyl-CoA dehydrogenase family protein [Thermodesulfobacteriota bacterium]